MQLLKLSEKQRKKFITKAGDFIKVLDKKNMLLGILDEETDRLKLLKELKGGE